MAVTPAYRDYVVEQLERITPIRTRSMFGGVGIYSEGLFFALIAGDVLYFKVDDTNRADYEGAGSGPFMPYDAGRPMQYYELPGELLEDTDALRPWVLKALDVARSRARRSSR